MSRRGRILSIALAFALSGSSALVFEVVWVELFGHLVGTTTLAISSVLACYMGGLALGSYVAGQRAARITDPLRWYAILETCAAVSAAAVPLWLALLRPVYLRLAVALPPALVPVAGLPFVLMLLLPPTFCMGATLPVLSRFLVSGVASLGRELGGLYAVNTLGAVAGAFLGGFVLIPKWGFLFTTGVATAGNLLAAVLALRLRRMAAEQVPWRDASAGSDRRARQAADPGIGALGFRVLIGVFALSGFAALGFELYWTRALQQFLGNSTYAFSSMLTTFLLFLALGSWVGGFVADRVRSPARVMGWIQIGVAVSAALTVPLIWRTLARLAQHAAFSAPALDWTSYLVRRFMAAGAVMVVPTFLLGMMFPLVNRIGVSSAATLGHSVGRLYAANTIGAVAGTLAAAFVVLPLLGTRGAIFATALLCAVVGVFVHVANRRRGGFDHLLAAVVVLALVVGAPALHRASRPLLSDTQEAGDAVLFAREDRSAETRVYRKANGELHMSIDGRHIGGTEPITAHKEKLLAHLPLALAARAENVLAVGLGSGITLSRLALYDEVQRLTCVEIVPGVVDGARVFEAHNNQVWRDPRLRLRLGDGIHYLLTTHHRFDVISSDPKLNPEFAGNSDLLARDYYELCREHLTEGGVMVQWMPVHVPHSVIRLVTQSFVAAFPFVELFWTAPADIMMVGSRSPIEFDFERWRRRSAAGGVRADLEALQLDEPYLLAATRVAGRARILEVLGDGPVTTWMRPRYEFLVVREFRRKAQEYHENDNLRWLAALWSPQDFAMQGVPDHDRLARFRASTHHYLLGFGSGGGTERAAAGRPLFEAGLRLNPEDRRLAHVLVRLDSQLTQVALPAAPANAVEWLERGLLLLGSERAQEALGCFERAIALDAGSPAAHYNRLLVLRQLGGGPALHAAVERFTRDFPGDARGWSLWGQGLAERGELETALEAFGRAVDIDPSTASFRNNLAVTLVRLGRYELAGSVFAQLHALDPLFPDAAFFAASAYSLAGNTRQAAHWVDVVLATKQGDPRRFLADENFRNLRASPDWQRQRIEQAVAVWGSGRRSGRLE